MRRGLGVVLVVLVAATALVACGSADDRGSGRAGTATASSSPQARPPPAATDDVTAARGALVRLADLPKPWTVQGGNVTRLRCGGFDPFAGADALVSSRRLVFEGEGVQERIALYRSAAAAARALRRLDSRTAANCLRHELRRHVSAEAGGPSGPARLVRAERLGPTSHAKRYTSIAVGTYGKVAGFIDAVHARVGRALLALVLVSSPQPPEEALYERVVAVVTHRLQATSG